MNCFNIFAIILVLASSVALFFAKTFNAITASLSAVLSFFISSILLDSTTNLLERTGWKENVYSPAFIFVMLFVLGWGICYTLASYIPAKKTFLNIYLRLIIAFVFTVPILFGVFNTACYILPPFLSSSERELQLDNSLLCSGGAKTYLHKIQPNVLQERVTQYLTPKSNDEVVLLPDNLQLSNRSKNLQVNLLALINNERSSSNLDSLNSDENLNNLASEYAQEIFVSRRFSHVDANNFLPSDRAKIANISFNYFGENLAIASSVEKAHQVLMESADHRKNILSPIFKRVGIAVYNLTPKSVLVVEDFSN